MCPTVQAAYIRHTKLQLNCSSQDGGCVKLHFLQLYLIWLQICSAQEFQKYFAALEKCILYQHLFFFFSEVNCSLQNTNNSKSNKNYM